MSPDQIERFRALLAMLEQRKAAANHAPEDIAGQHDVPAGAQFASPEAAWEAIREADRKAQQAALRQLWEMTPPGSAMAAYDAAERGDLPGTIVGAIGVVPGGGALGQAAKGVLKTTKAMRSAWKAAGVADDLPVDAASRARRLAEQGYERGWWRGGVEPGDGIYYSSDRRTAADVAREKKKDYGRGDLREYAMAFRKPLRDDALISPAELRAAAAEVGSYNPYAAAQFREMAATGEKVHGVDLRKMLDAHSEGTDATLRALGYDAIIGGRDARVIDRGIVRDANRAAFDPALRGRPGIFGGMLPFGLGGGAMLGYGRSLSDDERPTW